MAQRRGETPPPHNRDQRDNRYSTVNQAYPHARQSYHLRGTMPPGEVSYPVEIPDGLPPAQIRGTEPPQSFGVRARNTQQLQPSWLTEDFHLLLRIPCDSCNGTGDARILVMQCPDCYQWMSRKVFNQHARRLANGRKSTWQLPCCGYVLHNDPMFIHPPCKRCAKNGAIEGIGRGYIVRAIEIRDLFNLYNQSHAPVIQAAGGEHVTQQHRIDFYNRQVEQIRQQSGETPRDAFPTFERDTPRIDDSE